MELKSFIIFLSIVLIIYFSVNLYIYKRAMHSLSLAGKSVWFVRTILFILILAFPIGRIIDATARCKLSFILTMSGSIWLGVMLYAVLLLALIDGYRLLDHFFNVSPRVITAHIAQTRRILFAIAFFLVVLILSYGFMNARNCRISNISIYSEKYPTGKSPLTIVHLSDIHLGTIINETRLFKIVERVNRLNPDLVLITGDLIDENVSRISDLVQPLSKMKGKYGVYAVTGNHEVYAGLEEAIRFMKAAGITVLRNETVAIDSAVNISGLEDYTINRKLGTMPEIIRSSTSDANENLPTILMNHQPIQLEAAQAAGIDLMLCGHTHNGQLFPLSLFTSLIYRVSSGYAKLGDMQIYVSNGVGTWGPPMRLGAQPEIVKISFGRPPSD
ncbi:metallophosphoesterase [candidate division KSB1 bacterium]|nr:metallophosphoesterase [candidate division KSB1 bacterium]